LQQASFKLAEALYQKTGGAQNGANGATNGAGEGAHNGAHDEASAPPPTDDVIDAEFKEAK
jgi:hypothetical protein